MGRRLALATQCSFMEALTTRAYHTAFRLRATEVVVEEKRGGDVTIRGPHRYYLAEVTGEAGRHQVLDRVDGAVVDEGPWLNMWGLALRLNGVDLLAPDGEVAA